MLVGIERLARTELGRFDERGQVHICILNGGRQD